VSKNDIVTFGIPLGAFIISLFTYIANTRKLKQKANGSDVTDLHARIMRLNEELHATKLELERYRRERDNLFELYNQLVQRMSQQG
jgi:hypothetical protein